MIEQYDKMIANQKVDTLLDTEVVTIRMSKTGSPFTRKIPLIIGTILLRGAFSISEVVEAVHEPACRVQWDDGYAQFKLIETISNNFSLLYLLNKVSVPGADDREFYEKKFMFNDGNDKIFIFNTSVPY